MVYYFFSINLSSIILSNYTRSDFNSQILFSEIGLSKSQANRKIKSLTGVTPNQLIQESRLQMALGCLTHHNKTISEIAYESGFNSPTYFSRVFKKRFGVSPRDLVQSHN